MDYDTNIEHQEESNPVKEKIKPPIKKIIAPPTRAVTHTWRSDRDDNQLATKKMTSDTKTQNTSSKCSKDHQLRERASVEKREQKLKKFAQRVPATRKLFYKYGGVEDKEADHKEKLKYIEEIKRSSVENEDMKAKPNYLNPRKSSREIIKDPHLLEIEMQLKSLQSQKRKVNELIYRELRDTKSSWRDLTSKTSLLDIRNLMNRSEDEHIKNLCKAMEKTTQQVANLHRSYTDFDNSKNGAFDNLKEDDKNDDPFNFLFERGDNNEMPHLKKCDETFQTDFGMNDANKEYCEWYPDNHVSRPTDVKNDRGLRMNLSKYPQNGDRYGMFHSSCDTATEMLSKLDVSKDDEELSSMSTKIQGIANSFHRDEESLQSSNLENSKVSKQSTKQSNSVMPYGLANKYPLLHTKMLKSEYLRKSFSKIGEV